MRLLIVEDEDSIRSALVRALIQAGHSVSAAPSLAAARAVLAERGGSLPDCLISDLKLPDGSGLELAAWLVAQAQHGGRKLPFILMSGYAGFDDAVQALRLGCVEFFTKPVAIRDIRRALGAAEAIVAEQAARSAAPERSAAPAPSRNASAVAPASSSAPASAAAGEPAPLRVLDPAGDCLLVVGAQVVQSASPIHAVTWDSIGSAHDAFVALRQMPVPFAPDALHALAELLQSVPRGRLVVDASQTRPVAWLTPVPVWQSQQDRAALLAELAVREVRSETGLLIELPVRSAHCNDDPREQSGDATWLFPRDTGAADHAETDKTDETADETANETWPDLRRVARVGAWLLSRLRQRPPPRSALSPGVQRQCAALGIALAESSPSAWSDEPRGVGADERALLFADLDPGAGQLSGPRFALPPGCST